ncbi:DUF4062 domain-containing protein [Vibrio owensii]|uniref:DUF4062 domain-containing protein n=1 Tax=Vibrio owensii TaxID=696485 RepID=UPI00374A422C
MNSKKYQVFISSTYKDLVEERESIIKAILEMYHVPIGMEMFSAEDEEQWEIIRRTIDVSDYYILILGLRYGSKTSDGISFTQKEYEYALEKKIPVLAFVMDEDAPLTKDKRDNDLTDINNFREMVLRNSKMAQFWETKDQLIKNVSISLMKQIFQKPGIGWVRGDKLGTEEALSKELTNLSQENRELRQQISELMAKVSPKSPSINVKITPDSLTMQGCEFKPTLMPERFSLKDCPEHIIDYIKMDEVTAFNESLPTIEQLTQYNNEKAKYFYVNNCSLPLSVVVSNLGTCKANNVYVEITFPEELLIYKADDEIDEPKSILPKSPLVGAQKRYNASRALRPTIYDNLLGRSFEMGNLDALSKHFTPISPEMLGRESWSKLRDNKLTLRINNLLHTREVTFDEEYNIAPLKSGTHTVEAAIICEELDQRENVTFFVTVQ